MTQGRARPAGRAEEDEEGIDDAEGGSRRTADQRTPDSKNDRRAEVFWRQVGNPWIEGKALQPEARR